MLKCGKCGFDNPDTKKFCSQCGSQFYNPVFTRVTQAEINLKTKEVQLLQEKFDNESSHLGPIILFIVGILTSIVLVGILIIFIAWMWDKSRSASATETEIKLLAAKAELERIKQLL